MANPEDLNCPYCGAPIEIDIDVSAGARQQFTSDCEVCCRPIVWTVTVDAEGTPVIQAQAEQA